MRIGANRKETWTTHNKSEKISEIRHEKFQRHWNQPGRRS